MGLKRDVDTGRKDSLGRSIKESGSSRAAVVNSSNKLDQLTRLDPYNSTVAMDADDYTISQEVPQDHFTAICEEYAAERKQAWWENESMKPLKHGGSPGIQYDDSSDYNDELKDSLDEREEELADNLSMLYRDFTNEIKNNYADYCDKDSNLVVEDYHIAQFFDRKLS